MPRIAIALLLKGGDRRSIGRANHVASLVLRQPKRIPELVTCLWSNDPIIRMRAADAAEKISRQMPGPFRRFIPELLGLADEAVEIELRWHLASIIPRLNLSSAQRLRAFARFREYLQDRSSIVKTFALQALADLADSEEKLRPEVADLLAQAARAGTPAMRARARKLALRWRLAAEAPTALASAERCQRNRKRTVYAQ